MLAKAAAGTVGDPKEPVAVLAPAVFAIGKYQRQDLFKRF